MLFNSFAFLFAFLPGVLLVHWLAVRFRPRLRIAALVAASAVFYGYWDIRFLPLLAASILLNWLVARVFQHRPAGWLIGAAIAANLAVLGLFKYAGFAVDLLNALPGVGLAKPSLVLPLGISFFTFHHIMYLTDLRAGRAPRYGLVDYAFYIAFFPQVLAGPLVRWSEIMPQLGEDPYRRPDAASRIGRGLMLLILGLAKKVLIGDALAEHVNPVFATALAGGALTFTDAWSAVLGFGLQIYFDFSGYTDMALGIALLFGIVLPPNFDAPYRATSLQDFWRRWHMTLSRFLRDYLYIPLGGSRHGLAVQVGALFATMTLGGLWHGAGLTFVAWGVAHGLGLGAGLLWRRAGLGMPSWLGWALTLAFVTLAWVLFRAPSFDAAARIYAALAGLTEFGGGFRWRNLVVAGALALVGPTAWSLVHRLPPSRPVAIACAILLVVILFKIGDDANYEFIYFQF